MSEATRANTICLDSVSKQSASNQSASNQSASNQIARSSSEPGNWNRHASFSAADFSHRDGGVFSLLNKEALDDEGSPGTGHTRRRPLGVVDLNASPLLVGSSTNPQNAQTGRKIARRSVKGLRPPPFSRSASYDGVGDEHVRLTPSFTVPKDSKREAMPSSNAVRSLSLMDRIEQDDPADITPSSSFSSDTPIFRNTTEDNPQSGFWTEEMSDMLTLKRANPVYDSEEDEDDAYYNYHVSKRLRTSEPLSDEEDEDDVDYVHKMWSDGANNVFPLRSDNKRRIEGGVLDLSSLIEGSPEEAPSRVETGI